MKRHRFPQIVTVLVLIFIYLPILILVVNSFNGSRYGSVWGGFSLRWYDKLFHDREIWRSVKNTMIVAFFSTAVSVVLGTLAGFTLYRFKSVLQKTHKGLISLPLVFPDVLMGMSLILFFISVKIPLSLLTVILGHITFCISYVAVTVLSRFQEFDFSLVEAARDLGAPERVVLFRIIIPLLLPGILSGAMLALTLSLDDFIITFFTAGPGASTLPIQIYSMIRFGSPPVINALSTLFLGVTFFISLIYQRLTRSEK